MAKNELRDFTVNQGAALPRVEGSSGLNTRRRKQWHG